MYNLARTCVKSRFPRLGAPIPPLDGFLHDNVCVVLQTNWERFSAQLKTALDKGWMAWATQAMELHTYRANWENRRKEGNGFYKLNDESVVAVREDLA